MHGDIGAHGGAATVAVSLARNLHPYIAKMGIRGGTGYTGQGRDVAGTGAGDVVKAMQAAHLFTLAFFHGGQQPDPAGTAFLARNKDRVEALGSTLHAHQSAFGFGEAGGGQGQSAGRQGGVIQGVQHNDIGDIRQQCIDTGFWAAPVKIVLKDNQGVQFSGGSPLAQLGQACGIRPG